VTLAQAVALYVGAVLGAGVLILPGTAASQAGPASLLSWAAVGLLGLPLALTFSRLASAIPDAGGVSTYVRLAFGADAGAVVGWFYFFAVSVGLAVVALTGAYYVAAAGGWHEPAAFGVAAAIMGAGVFTNIRGLRVSGRVQLGLAAAVAAMLLVAIATALPRVAGRHLEPFAPDGLLAAARAAVPLFFAFAGWEAITHLSAEFQQPERDITRATVLAVAAVVLLYMGVAFAVVGTRTYGSTELNRIAVARLLGDGIGVGAQHVAAGMAVVITLGTTNAFVAANSRLGFALARDGAFPRPLSRLDARGVPRVSVLLVGTLSGAALALAFAFSWGAEDLVFVPSALVVATYVLGMGAAARLLRGSARRLALTALAFCIAVAPFVGASAVVPLAVAAAALIYRRVSIMQRR
jgi:amino acid efflux transporter